MDCRVTCIVKMHKEKCDKQDRGMIRGKKLLLVVEGLYAKDLIDHVVKSTER